MPDSGAESHWGLVGEPPVDVEVTVLSAPRSPTGRDRVRLITALRSVHVLLAVVLAAAATASVIAAVTTGGGGGRAVGEAGGARQRGPALAAAYGYPLRCVSVAIALHDPRFARPDFDRTLPCGRYRGYPAIDGGRGWGQSATALRRAGCRNVCELSWRLRVINNR